MKKFARIRPVIAVAVLLLTIGAFIHYFATHPQQLDQLRHLSPALLATLLGLYGLTIVSLVLILAASLAVVNVRMKWADNFLITSYSSIVNFFGPLQSGPGVRMVYLKRKYNVGVKQFLFGTFLYYGFYALFSGFLVSFRVFPWWLTILALAAIAGFSLLVIRRIRRQAALASFSIRAVGYLALATMFQVALITVLYFVELHSINSHITFAQAATYTGAANFALFVSLTPGAIGFRESFLLFSQRLHGIDTSQILSASLIDRATNVAFLGLLFLITLAFHAKQRLTQKTVAAETTNE